MWRFHLLHRDHKDCHYWQIDHNWIWKISRETCFHTVVVDGKLLAISWSLKVSIGHIRESHTDITVSSCDTMVISWSVVLEIVLTATGWPLDPLLFRNGYYNTNKAKKDPIKAVNPNAIIPAPEELFPLGGTYSVSTQGKYHNTVMKKNLQYNL
jgi:hypothetical protein